MGFTLTNEFLSQRIREFRNFRGYTGLYVSSHLPITNLTLVRWETNKTNIPFAGIIELSIFYDFHLKWFFQDVSIDKTLCPASYGFLRKDDTIAINPELEGVKGIPIITTEQVLSNLRSAREARHYTMVDVCRTLGLDYRSLHRNENTTIAFPAIRAMQYAKHYGVPLEVVFGLYPYTQNWDDVTVGE